MASLPRSSTPYFMQFFEAFRYSASFLTALALCEIWFLTSSPSSAKLLS